MEAKVIVNFDTSKPIYIQISEWLETEIMAGNIVADEKIYSQYQLAEIFNINPATAAKGLTILIEENILYKKRGLGMFVTTHAKEMILQKRKDLFLKNLVFEIVREANHLSISEDELIHQIKLANQQLKEGK